MNLNPNIFSNQPELVSITDKENLLQQEGLVIWMTGLSGSGKSTLAYLVEKALFEKGVLTKVLDGDVLRLGLNKELGFSNEGRYENIRRTAELAKQLASCGIVVICSLITPTNELRDLAKHIIGNEKFTLCHISSPLAVCEELDVKGHYAKAREGNLKNFTGIDNLFEVPENAKITIDTSALSIEESRDYLFNYIYALALK